MTPEATVPPPRRNQLTTLLRSSAVRYLIAGGAAFLFDFGLLWVFREVFHWPTWLAAGLAFVLSFAFTYTVQRMFAFGSDAPHGRTLLRYTLLVIFNTLATAAIVSLVDLTAAGWGVGKIAATACMTVWNYFIYRYWVFTSTRTTAAETGTVD